MEKKRILICIDWFEPAYKAGGPIRSIKNMVELLKKDFDFFILTSDRDLGDDTAFQDVELNTWVKKDGFSIYYLSKEHQQFKYFADLLKERSYHKYYFNSLFSLKFTLIPLLILRKNGESSKAILAPRGMLGQGALQIKSRKKKLFLSLSRMLGLYKNINWHASTELEKKEIYTIFGEKARVSIAQNIAQKVESPTSLNKEDTIKFIFLSRISSKKNLLKAIAFFDELEISGKRVFFDIYGPIEDMRYWESCKDQIKKLKGNVKVEHKGMLDREKIYLTLSSYHFLLFPTKNENFGHNIAEALLCGLPVIISDQTPWKNLEANKAGWDISLKDERRFKEVIKTAIEMEDREYEKWRKSARLFAEEKLFSEEVYQCNKMLFSPKSEDV